MTDPAASSHPPSFWGRAARFLGTFGPLISWLSGVVGVVSGQLGPGSILESGPPLNWTIALLAGACALGMVRLARAVIHREPEPRAVLGLLALALVPWVWGMLGIWVSARSTLSDPASTGFAGYAAMVLRQVQGTYFTWNLLGSAAFALTVATFIRRSRPTPSADALPVAISVIPALVFAVFAANKADLGFFGASLVGVPVSALILLPFVGAATRSAPAQGTVLPGIGAAVAFGLAFTAALSAAYGIGIGRMLFAIYAVAGVGAGAVQAGLAKLATLRSLPVVGLVIALVPAGVIAWQLNRRSQMIPPALLGAVPLLVAPLGLHLLVSSKSHKTLEGLAVARPAEPATTLADTMSVDTTASPVDTVTGVPGGVIGGVGAVAPPPPAPVTPPEPISRFSPAYPEVARQAGLSGTVILEVEVDAEGAVTGAKVLKSAAPMLDQAALDAIRRWRYRPAMQGGQPVAGRRVEQIRFQRE